MKSTHFSQIRKRDGRLVPFDQEKITQAIFKGLTDEKEGDLITAQKISDKVIRELEKKYPPNHILGIESIQDVVEEVLILEEYAKTAKHYILYRKERANLREQKKQIPEHVKKLVAESKKYFRNSLAEFIYYRTYSRWLDSEGRRETWIETVDRYIGFMKDNLGNRLADSEYAELREAILKQEIMPSMRLMWSAGKAARTNAIYAYNCSFIAPSKIDDFAEIMYLSMSGAGVGFSVESQSIQQLPIVQRQSGKKLKTHVIADSKEGWCDAVKASMKAWYAGRDIDFDFSQIRPAGVRLMTMGGRSSGPEPLRQALEFAKEKILSRQGKRLKNIDAHDIICKIGEVVVMGGVRRTALISLSDLDDEEMRHAKTGQFYITESQRSLANNSVAYNSKPSNDEFLAEWIALAKSGTGERGIFNRGDLKSQVPERRWKLLAKDAATTGTNPCVTGDTLVYVADGRGHVAIKQLASEGRDVPVFCLNDKKKITVRYLRHPRLTGKKSAVYEIKLDDGSIIKATTNHKFLLKNGRYKQVSNLRPGDGLSILTKFEASIKDVFKNANSKSQDYWWVNNGQGNNEAEHRLIAAFHYNTKIPKGHIVHHRDRNAQNNFPDNLEILTKETHDDLHSQLMIGNNNPMRRASYEWSQNKWRSYKLKHSLNNIGAKNKNSSGFTHADLQTHALRLTQKLGRRFSNADWSAYAKQYGLPRYFSKWRQDHLGGVLGLAKWSAQQLNFDHINADPRVIKSYQKYTAQGYNCVVAQNQLIISKICETCGKKFVTSASKRECGVCGISCGLKRMWADPQRKQNIVDRINQSHESRRRYLREAQAKIYNQLKFELNREPSKKEWARACAIRQFSAEISRASSPFQSLNELREYASMCNHKVVSIKFAGYEDVYNGTVDEFHNFFVGGFDGATKNRKRKFAYLNNLQCGEIILKSKQFCNLTEVVARPEDTEESLLRKMRLATIMGTYQSTLTDFPYLSKEWRRNCEEERLLGVSITGQWDCPTVRQAMILAKLKEEAINTNKVYAKKFGINQSAAITCVKPSGTVSQLVDTSSGMHPRHAPYYVRRVRISATDPLFHMLRDQKFKYYPEVGQTMADATTFVLEFPIQAPPSSVFKDSLTALQQLEHWRLVKENFTEHNPSVTVSVGDDEWIGAANWLYEHWNILGGLSFLPREKHVYKLAPYETISAERYQEMARTMPEIDFANIVAYERDDMTQGAKELACVAGVCEI